MILSSREHSPRTNIRRLLLVLSILSGAFAPHPIAQTVQAPFGRPDIPISSTDRVYAADQTSNTVSVIDPYAQEIITDQQSEIDLMQLWLRQHEPKLKTANR